MIRRFVYWDEWRKAYWDKMDRYPELFALLHRMYVAQYYGVIQPPDRKKKPGPFSHIMRVGSGVKRRLQRRMKRRVAAPSPVVSRDHEDALQSPSSIDVLFYAYARRDTCLGVGEKLFQGLAEVAPTTRLAYYQNATRPVIDRSVHQGAYVLTLQRGINWRGVTGFIRMLPVLLTGACKSGIVARYVLIHLPTFIAHALKICCTAEAQRRFLKQYRPRIIIACNEQGGSDNSILFAVARKMGIHTVQYLHCPPTRQFVPFICSEYWNWSPLTRSMLLGEQQDDRVLEIGCLEHDVSGAVAAESTSSSEIERILFLSQAGMDEGWGIHAVEKGVELFRQGLGYCRKPYLLRIRIHPNEDAWRARVRENLFEGLSYEVSDKHTAIEQDVEWASRVYTVSSNGIFAAFRLNRPGFLLWSAELDEIYGRAFLPDRFLVRNAEEWMRSLECKITVAEASQVLDEVLGPPGSVKKAVNRISEIVLND